MTSFMHFELNGGRVTAAIQVENQIAEVGLAFCSPQDQFARKRGRLIAEGRLNAGKAFCYVPVNPGDRAKEKVMAWLREYLPTSQSAPWWVNPENKNE